MKHLRIFCCLVGILFSLTVLHAQDCHWNLNPYDYKYDMTVYARLTLDGNEVTDFSNYEIAAFVDDECRGVGEVQTKDSYTWIYLRIRSNTASGEKVSFRLYDKSADRTLQLQAEQSIKFSSQGMVGTPSSPVTLDKPAYTLGDVNEDGEINVTDIVAVRRIIAKSVSSSYNELAADVNQDGEINVTDIVSIRRIIANKNQ